MTPPDAAAIAAQSVVRVADDPAARLALLRDVHELPGHLARGHLPFRRAASAFMGWQLRRGLLNPTTADPAGSPWWRAVNADLLHDLGEARELALGRPGEPSNAAVEAWRRFISRPSARAWYRAHNLTVARAYLAHESLARDESRVERFFINLVLMRVLYAHAMVAEPRLALGRLAPVSRPLGDPRLGMTALFLSLSRVLPDRYPLGDDVERYVAAEHGFGHLLDVGVISPRATALYEWSAATLGLPGLAALFNGDTPCYAWDPGDADVWRPPPSRLARAASRAAPVRWATPPGRDASEYRPR